MNSISTDIALKFCELCNWAYECWITHKRLFDDNGNTSGTIERSKHFTSRLSFIIQEYTLLQICKLHDPSIQNGSLNVSIEYIKRFGGWGPDAARIQKLVSQLHELFEKLKSARNKVLAHNDLETLMSSSILGEFPVGLDVQYFSVLQELVNEVHAKWLNGPYPFNDLAGADVDEFLSIIKKA